jgi:hypothetical protein
MSRGVPPFLTTRAYAGAGGPAPSAHAWGVPPFLAARWFGEAVATVVVPADLLGAVTSWFQGAGNVSGITGGLSTGEVPPADEMPFAYVTEAASRLERETSTSVVTVKTLCFRVYAGTDDAAADLGILLHESFNRRSFSFDAGTATRLVDHGPRLSRDVARSQQNRAVWVSERKYTTREIRPKG